MANIFYYLQIAMHNQFLTAQCIDGTKIQNDFEEIESIFDHSCMVKSNREYFWYTTELRVSSGLSGQNSRPFTFL